MEEVLFISNKTFLDVTQPEGGVRLCTTDYIELLQQRYKVHLMGVGYNRGLLFRMKFRLGIDAYEEYVPANYHKELEGFIVKKGITKIFINLSNLSEFAAYIKTAFAKYNVKTILCSHGNESGDFLHQSVRFTDTLNPAKNLFSAYRLGKVLQKEALYRHENIDCVLTVSDVEESIEKWLGAKTVCNIPRVLKNEFISWQPIKGRIGFVGDTSHPPNYFGLLKLCEAFVVNGIPDDLDIRIVGKENNNTTSLRSRFSFVTITGYLDNEQLIAEAGTWNYYLNLVFYYSKGVSTKLQKGLNWGLPIMSTTAGNRGYVFNNSTIPVYNTPAAMAVALHEKLQNENMVVADRQQTINAVHNTVTYHSIMNDISTVLENL